METTLAERVSLALVGPPKRSQLALAKACGVHPVSVNDWVHGRTQRIDGVHLLKAATFLDVNAKWLAEGIGPMRPNPSGDASTGREVEQPTERLDGIPSARKIVLALAGLAVQQRPTLRKNLGNLLVDLVEHPDDEALIEQTIADIERFFEPPAAPPKVVLVGNLGGGRESAYDKVIRQSETITPKPPAGMGPIRSKNAGKPKP